MEKLKRLFIYLTLLAGLSAKTAMASEPIYLYPLTPLGDDKLYFKQQPRLFFDENGILTFPYAFGDEVNPLFMATYLLTLIDDNLVEQNPDDEVVLNRHLAWLDEHMKVREYQGLKFLTYAHPFTNEYYNAPPGWSSALTNSRLLALYSVLYRVYGREKDLLTAKMLFNSFLVDKDNGGVITTDKGLWFEEVADPSVKSSKILNGHIGAVMGIWTYYKNIPSSLVKRYLDEGVKTVQTYLPEFDAGFTSYYDLDDSETPRKIAPVHGYNHQHIRQIEWLQCYSEDYSFAQYATEFNTYENYHYQVMDTTLQSDVTRKLHANLAGQFVAVNKAKNLEVTFDTPVSLDEFSLVQYPSYESADYNYQLKAYDINNQLVFSEQVSGVKEYYHHKAFDTQAQIAKIEVELEPNSGLLRLASMWFDSKDYPSVSSNWWIRNSSNNSNKLFSDGFKTARVGYLVVDMGKYRDNTSLNFEYKLPNEQTIYPKLTYACVDDYQSISSAGLTEFSIAQEQTTYSFNAELTSSCPILYMEYSGFGSQGRLEYINNDN